MAGAPLGNQNAKKAKRWSNAIERAMDAWPDRAVSLEINKGVDEAAYAFVKDLMTLEPEKRLGHFKELGDRYEGKPAQIIAGDDELPPIQVKGVIDLVKPSG